MSKKILHIIDNLGLWGAQTVVKGIFEIQNWFNDVFLFAMRKVEINTQINHSNIIINNTNNKLSFPIIKLIKVIKENNIEVIHCHLAKSQIIWWLLKTLFFPNIKLVLHEHWEIFEDGKIYPFIMNSFRNKVNVYLWVSNATKLKILEKTNYNENQIKVIYNFVDLDKFFKIDNIDLELERKKYELEKNDFVVWFASRLNEAKWYKEFLDSAKILINKWNNIKFIIAWDWPDKNIINEYIEKNNLNNSIKMIGYVKNMNIFYNIIDIFVFPSHRESLWITWIEANSCACPVIATNIEWLNEIMIDKHNALLFEKKNSLDLSEKIEKLYNDENLKNELIKNWLEEVKKYSLNKYIIELNKIYE